MRLLANAHAYERQRFDLCTFAQSARYLEVVRDVVESRVDVSTRNGVVQNKMTTWIHQ